MSRGECKAFKRAAVEVCGLTPADQTFIDETIERGVGACKWRRPQPRTPSCADLRAEIAQLRRATPAVQPPPKKKPLWRRVIGR